MSHWFKCWVVFGWMAVAGLVAGADAPPNDNFANAIVLSPSHFRVSGTNVGASLEVGETPFASNVATVWYKWTAPASTTIGMSLYNSTFDTVLAVYTGNSVNNLTMVASNDDGFISATFDSYTEFAATAGTTYYIAVGGFTEAVGTFVLEMTPTANDAFASRLALTGSSFTYAATDNLATKEAGEPNHGGDAGGASLWFSWVAPASGRYGVTTLSGKTNFDTLLGVYTGNAVNALTLVGQNDDSTGTASHVSFNAVAGTEYQIAVDGKAGAKGGFILSLSPAPANDDFANAALLTGASAMATGDNIGASKEAGEPMHGGNAGGASLWYKWTAPSTGTFGLSTCGSTFDTLLAVYTGTSVSALTMVAQNDDDLNVTYSTVNFAAAAGTTYYFAVDGKNNGVGSYLLTLAARPANDNFANATLLQGSTVTVTGDNIAATKEAGEAAHAGNAGGKSVWYTYTPASAGLVHFSVNSSMPVILAVYSGTAINALTQLIGIFNPAVPTLTVNTASPPGQPIYIAIDGVDGAAGVFSLSLSLTAPVVGPLNDNFSDAQAISGLDVDVAGTTLKATLEGGEPHVLPAPGQHSVWYAYTAPATRPMGVTAAALAPTVSGTTYDLQLAVYTGSTLGALTLVAANDNTDNSRDSALTFNATAGSVYYIQVETLADGSPSGGQGTFELGIHPATLSFGPSGKFTATPNPAVANEAVTFSAPVDAAATITYDFGDGTQLTTTQKTITHVYSAAGTYKATVTASVPTGASLTDTLSLLVRNGGDLTIGKTALKLVFNKSKSDSLSVSGSFAVPDGASVAGQTVIFNFGAISRTFTLDGKGSVKSGGDSIKIAYKSAPGGGTAKFSVKLSKDDLAATLAPLGFDNATNVNKPITVLVQFILNNTTYEATPTLFYKSAAGKVGGAK